MASKEAINAKFEALEAQMEDKIRTLFLPNSVWAEYQARRNHIKERARTNHTKPKEMTSTRGEAL